MPNQFTRQVQNHLLQGPRVPQRISSFLFRPKTSALNAANVTQQLLGTSIPHGQAARAVSFSLVLDSAGRPIPIEQVSVAQRAVELERPKESAKPTDTPITARERRTRGIIAAGSLAALAAILIPKLAYAGTLGGALAALASNPLGIVALVGGGLLLAAFYIKHLYGFDKTMTHRNSNPGDSTLRKQMATFSIIPLSIMAGSGLLYLGACLLPWGATPVFFGLAGAGLIYGIYKTLNAMVKTVRANRQTITPGYKSNPRQTAETNLFSYAVQGAEAAYMFYRGATVFELIVGIGAFLGHSIAATGLVSLGAGALILGLPLFLVGRHYLKFTSGKWNELQHQWGPRMTTRKTILLASGAAVAGALIWNFAPILINLTFALAFLFTEVHALIHNWSCQEGSREVIQTPPKEFSDTAKWKAARTTKSPWITVQKPSLNPTEFIIPILATLYLRKGVHWDFLNITSGGGFHADSREAIECMRFMQKKQEAILKIVNDGRTRINATPTLAAKYEELAKLYEELAALWQRESVGDFRELKASKLAKKNNVFIDPNAEEFERYLGEVIAYEGRKFSALAAELRGRPAKSPAEVDEHLDALTEQYSVIFHWFSTSQFRNLAPDVRRSKIRKIDLVNMILKTFKTGSSVLRKNRFTGKYYWEFIPCRRVRVLNTDTNRLSWANRSDAEMAGVQSFSDIAHADNTGMTDPAGPVHSPEAYTYGKMQEGDRFTLAYKNGRRETFVMHNGTVTVDHHGRPRDPKTEDEVVWVPGMPLTPELAKALPKEFKDKDGNVQEEYIRPRLFHVFGSRYQTMLDGEHADVQTSNYLATLERDLEDPYLLSLWKVPEEVAVPNALHLRESENDRLVRIHPSYACFMLRVKEKDSGKTLFIPYDWKKSRLISDDFWTKVHHVELMSRQDFQTKFEKVCTDNHGDKHEYVIVAYDANGNKLGKPNEALPYSYYLREPSFYSSAEFDRGLGRIGDMIFIAYTFERADGSRYLRWLPKAEDFQEMDFDEKHQSFEVRGDKIILHACRWIGKRFYFDRHRLGLDAGTHDNPNFEVTAIEGPERFLSSIGATGRFVLARCSRNPGRIAYVPFAGRIGNLDHVVDQKVNGADLELVRITSDDKRVVALGSSQMLQHPSTWISGVSFNRRAGSNTADSITVTFTNPFDHTPAGTQVVALPKPVDLSQTYWEGGNQAYLPKIFDQRQRDPKTKKVENRIFLTFYGCETTPVQRGLTLSPNEEIRLIEVKSSLRVRHLTAANGKEGEEEWIPFDHEMPRASKSQVWFGRSIVRADFWRFGNKERRNVIWNALVNAGYINENGMLQPKFDGKIENFQLDATFSEIEKGQIFGILKDGKHTPFSSGLCFGRVDTVVGPQHLVPVANLAGPEEATDNQKFYFGENKGEYNYYAGWIRPQKMPILGSRGPFSIQYAKSLRKAALNTGSNTVKRAPDRQHLLFAREELELYAERGMPVPILKSLFDTPTITEDAQSAWEAQRMLDEATENQPEVNTIGSSVKTVADAVGQRMRWAAMIKYLERIKKIVYDEIWRARIKKEIPPQYSNQQLEEWLKTFTWYLDTVFKHVVPLIPFVYMLGLSPLPAGAILFPLLWAIKTGTGWPKYSLDNQKVGVSRFRSYFRNLALYFLQIPGIERSVVHIGDEAIGPFMTPKPDKEYKGRTFQPWAIRRIVYYFGGLSGITTAIGLYRMIAFGMTAFGLVMNVIWPAFMFAGICYALGMVWKEMKHRNPSKSRSDLFKDEFAKPLTIEWFKELKAAWRNYRRYQQTGEI